MTVIIVISSSKISLITVTTIVVTIIFINSINFVYIILIIVMVEIMADVTIIAINSFLTVTGKFQARIGTLLYVFSSLEHRFKLKEMYILLRKDTVVETKATLEVVRKCVLTYSKMENVIFGRYYGHKLQTLFQEGQYFVAMYQKQLSRPPTTVSTLACLLNISVASQCISGMDLLTQLHVLPH